VNADPGSAGRRRLEHVAEKLEEIDDRGSRGRSWRWAIDARSRPRTTSSRSVSRRID